MRTTAFIAVLFFALPARGGDADVEWYQQVFKSLAAVVVPGAGAPRVHAATCISRTDGLFLADLDAVRDGDKAVLVLPRYGKDGQAVLKREEYLKWAGGQTPVPADRCVVHRDPKRCLAVLKFKELPEGVQHMPLADGVTKGDKVYSFIVSDASAMIWGLANADPRELRTAPTEIVESKKEGPTLQVWFQSQQWSFDDSPGQAFVNASGRLAGVRLSRRLRPAGEVLNTGWVLDVREVAGMLKDAKITLPKADDRPGAVPKR